MIHIWFVLVSTTTVTRHKQLCRININEREINTYSGHRIFTCWMDFSVRVNLIKSAIPRPQPPPNPTELPENVLSEPTATTASVSSTSVAPQQSAPATGTAAATSSKAQCKQEKDERLPLRIPPFYAPWLSQLWADLGVPLTTTTPEAFVFNINAIPPSPTRPIPSTSSSEARSQTPTCTLRYSARFYTVAYKIGSAGIIERVAGRKPSKSSDAQPLASFAARF